jgi:glycosyltransferase involved in cell wall biosynthesis
VRVYVHFPNLSGPENSMGLFTHQIADIFSKNGFDVVICCIGTTPLPFKQLVVPNLFRSSIPRIDALTLVIFMLFRLIGNRDFIIINISHEFIFPMFLRRSINIAHDTIQSEYPRNRIIKLLSYYWWFKARRSALNVSVSISTQTDLQKKGIISEVIYNSFDRAFLVNATPQPTAIKKYAAVWCGTLAVHKNFELFEGLCRRHGRLSFCAVLPQVDFKCLVDRGVSQNLKLRAGVSHAEYKSLVRNSRMLISTSLKEGYGRPPMEALMLGIPVLISDIPVYQELYGKFAFFHQLSIETLDAKFIEILEKSDEGVIDVPPLSELQKYQGEMTSYLAVAKRLFSKI